MFCLTIKVHFVPRLKVTKSKKEKHLRRQPQKKMKISTMSWKVKKERTSQNDFAVTDKHLSLLLSEEKVSRDAYLQLRFT